LENALHSDVPDADLHSRRLISLQGPHAAAWTTALPVDEVYRLSPFDWQLAATMRLGLPSLHLAQAGQCACGFVFTDPSLPGHALHCEYGKTRIHTHDVVKLAVAKMVQEAKFTSARVEDRFLLDGRRPDISCIDADTARIHVLDITITDPLCSSFVSRGATTPGGAAAVRAAAKESRYAKALKDLGGYKFWPLPLETYGAFGVDLCKFVQFCARRVARNKLSGAGLPPELEDNLTAGFSRRFVQMISVAQMRAQADAIRQRLQRRLQADQEAESVLRYRRTPGGGAYSDTEAEFVLRYPRGRPDERGPGLLDVLDHWE
jgi:hypothetical protein